MSTKGRIIGGLAAAAALLAVGMFLLGLPGLVIVEAADGLLGPSGVTAFKGDKAWPAAISVTNSMPIGVALSAVALAVVKPNAGVGASILWALLGYILAGVVAAIALVVID